MLKKIGLYVLVAVVLGISLGGMYTKSRRSAAAAELATADPIVACVVRMDGGPSCALTVC